MSLNLPLPIKDSYSYQTYQRQRQLTLGDLLLENRIVFLQGEIYTGNANEVVMKLLYLQSENRRKDVHFYLNSPGGDVAATLAICDTMQMLSCPICTYCVIKRILRLSKRSAAEPPTIVSASAGNPPQRFTIPSIRAEFVSQVMTHHCAITCIQVPVSEIALPMM